MKAKVVRAYIDKETKKARKVGESVELKGARFELLKDRGFVVEDFNDQKAEIEALKKENAELKAENAELKAVIEKSAAGEPEKPEK